MKQIFKPLGEYIDEKELEYKNDGRYSVFEFMEDVLNRRKFGKQTPKLGDFIPCDKEVKPLEKPKMWEDFWTMPTSDLTGLELLECEEYQEALERVKFEGFELRNSNEHSHWIQKDGKKDITFKLDGTVLTAMYQTLEDLTTLGLTLKHKI